MATQRDAPVFIKLEEYNEVMDIVAVIKKKLGESRETLNRIRQLKAEEEAELSAWARNLDDISKKVGFVDEIITEPKF